MTTGRGPVTVTLLMPAMKVAVCSVGWPIRMVLDSPGTSLEDGKGKVFGLRLPMSMLLSPVVRLEPALLPNAVLLLPVVLLDSALRPLAVFLSPVVLLKSASKPLAVLLAPVVL